jgi:contractile injection system tube protein
MSGEAPTSRIELTQLGEDRQPEGNTIIGQFNPATLQYTITNTAPAGNGNQRSREVDESTGKLTFDLIFDTTMVGSDVRRRTEKIAAFMKPGARRRTPVVRISWGEFRFEGALEQYQENLDFFSSEGIPLRATLSLAFTTVTDQNRTPDLVYQFAGLNREGQRARGGSAAQADVTGGSLTGTSETVEVPVGGAPPPRPTASGGDGPGTGAARAPRRGAGGTSASDLARRLGDPGRARAIGAQNGLEDIRNPADAEVLGVSDDQTLDGPVAFAAGAGAGFAAGVGVGIGIGAGGGVGVGVGVGGGVGVGVGVGAGIGIGIGIGVGVGVGGGAAGGLAAGGASAASARASGGASAGVAASQGAFALLRPPRPGARRRLDLERAFPAAASARVATDDDAAFVVGGRALGEGSAKFNADVGQRTSLAARLSFEED